MPLRPIPTADSWPAEILDEARPELTAKIEVVRITAGVFNPDTNTATASTVETIIPSRAARVQHLRYPLETDAAAAPVTRRHYRFQMETLPGDPVIEPGTSIRVLDGGRDPLLQHFNFTILIAASSNDAPLYTIETYAEFAHG